MNTALLILPCGILAFGIGIVVVAYTRVFSCLKGNAKTHQEEIITFIDENLEVDENLKVLESNENYITKARAFINLMQLSYVLVHTIVNEGNKYNDCIQSERFCKSLSKQLICSIYALEGKYE